VHDVVADEHDGPLRTFKVSKSIDPDDPAVTSTQIFNV
jgi:hypothetical protein